LLRTGVAAILVFLLAPLVFVVIVSFNAGTVPSFPPDGLSLRWYGQALGHELFQRGIVTSFWLALVATLIATPIGTVAAIGIARTDFAGRELLQTFLLAPLIVPTIVVGIAILVAAVDVGIKNSAARLIAGHVLIVLPYSIRTVLASLSRADVVLEEAARTLGANGFRVFYRVTLPLCRPGIIAGMILAFIISFDDVAVSLFLVDSKNNTLPIAILAYLEYNFDPSISAISALLIFVTLVAAIAVEKVLGIRRALGV
jgi:putative spermidine/putrescine transport system permease protein